MATSAGAPCAGPGSVGRIWPTVLAVFDSFFSSPWSRFSQGLLWEPFLTSVRFTGALLGFRVWPFPQQHQVDDVFEHSEAGWAISGTGSSQTRGTLISAF